MKRVKEQPKPEKKAASPQQRVVMKPDEDKKKNIALYLVRCRKNLRASIFVGNIMFISGIALAVSYILVNVAINSWNIGYVTGEPVKDYGSIIGLGLLYFAVGCLVSCVIRVTASTMSGKNIKDRTNEKVELEDGVLRYTYNNPKKLHLKKIIEMPLGEPEAAQAVMFYNPKTAEMIFRCDMRANEVDKNAEAGKKVTSSRIRELIVYDYFEPSLHMILKGRGYHFVEPENGGDVE